MGLNNLSNQQLISLFKVTVPSSLSGRGKAITSELSERGYFYDKLRGDFLTAEQWELLYQERPPTGTFPFGLQRNMR